MTTKLEPGMQRPAVRGRKLLLAMLAVFMLAVVPAIVMPTLLCRPEPPELKDLGTLPKLSLVDAEGRVFTEDALRGHPTIVNFIYTRCDTICPVVTATMAKLEEKTRDKRGAAIKFLSLTVDPEHDTPEVLAAYAAKHGVDFRRWKLVTGSLDHVRPLIEHTFMGMMDLVGKTPTGAPDIMHSRYFLLVDGDLQIRGAYNSSDIQRLDELQRAARYLARTQRSGYKFGGT